MIFEFDYSIKMGYKYCLFYLLNNPPRKEIVGYYNTREDMQQKLDGLPRDVHYLCQQYVRIPIPRPSQISIPTYHRSVMGG